MKKRTIAGLIILSAIFPLKAQIYTPSGTIQGTSGNNNIGIGTTNPSSLLTLRSTGNNAVITLNRQGAWSSVASGLKLTTDDAGTDYWNFGMLPNSTNTLHLGQNGGSNMSFLTNGNVGIGTTTPTTKLELSVGYANSIMNAFTLKNTFDGYGLVGTGIFFTGTYKHALISAYGNPQTRQGGKLQFQTYDSDAVLNTGIVLNEVGNLGIGTTTPRANLDMAKDISNGQLGTVFGRLPEGDGTGLGTYLGVKGYATQGPNEVKSFSIVHDFYGQTNSSINFYRGGSITGGFMTFNTYDNTEKMRIGANGYVGIGTTNPDSKLTVKGKIHAEEVKIDLSIPVPDYVFANDYKLKSLQEVENYINKNKHLPEIPSAYNIKKNGLMLAEMNMLLLKKVEELTLYIIEQNKRIEKLEKSNN